MGLFYNNDDSDLKKEYEKVRKLREQQLERLYQDDDYTERVIYLNGRPIRNDMNYNLNRETFNVNGKVRRERDVQYHKATYEDLEKKQALQNAKKAYTTTTASAQMKSKRGNSFGKFIFIVCIIISVLSSITEDVDMDSLKSLWDSYVADILNEEKEDTTELSEISFDPEDMGVDSSVYEMDDYFKEYELAKDCNYSECEFTFGDNVLTYAGDGKVEDQFSGCVSWAESWSTADESIRMTIYQLDTELYEQFESEDDYSMYDLINLQCISQDPEVYYIDSLQHYDIAQVFGNTAIDYECGNRMYIEITLKDGTHHILEIENISEDFKEDEIDEASYIEMLKEVHNVIYSVAEE